MTTVSGGKTEIPGALHEMGLLQAAGAVARGDVSPVELTEAVLKRIEELQPRLHAFAYVMDEQARARAKVLENEAMNGQLRGPLHGVPVAAKDLCDTKGVPTAAGFPMLRSRIPDENATVINRLEDAGAIVIGKTELSEGALALHHPDVALPVNPWRDDLWTGSSSSGSGVAVAAGLAMAAIGSDTGGSIRFPSHCNGVVGVKPTWGRVSRHGVVPLSWTLDHVGPMARRVDDAAAMLGVIAGRDAADPTSLATPVPDYVGGLDRSLKGVRLGFDEAYATNGVMEEIRAALFKAIEILKERGISLCSIRMPETVEANRAWTTICLSEAASVHRDLEGAVRSGYSQGFQQFIDAGNDVSGIDYARANLVRRQFAGNIDALFQDIDLMIVPVMGSEVPTVEEFARICPDPEGLERLIHFTCLYDVSGHPTITLPAGLSTNGSPIAFQLVGPRLGEDLLCRAGHAWQRDFGWDQRPPLN